LSRQNCCRKVLVHFVDDSALLLVVEKRALLVGLAFLIFAGLGLVIVGMVL
jgi:hypothetical protein